MSSWDIIIIIQINYELKAIQDQYGVNENEYQNIMTNKALAWASPLIETHDDRLNDLEAFLEAVSQVFDDPNCCATASDTLMAQHQGKSSIAEYATEFREWALPNEEVIEDPEQSSKLPSIYREFADVCDKKNANKLPPHQPYDCPIDLLPGAAIPFGSICPLAEHKVKAIKEYIDENLANGFIRPSSSPAEEHQNHVKTVLEDLSTHNSILNWKNCNVIMMENFTYNFFILTFTTHEDNKPFLSFFFVLVYLIGVLANSSTILVVYRDQRLHTPMYLFLCNLSIVDLCYTTTTAPNLVHMFLSCDYTLSFTQCFIQMYFFLHVATTEDLLLFIMVYDRYVAICKPLHYHRMLNKKNCILLMIVAWVIGCLNSAFATLTSSKICLYTNTVPQFFCEFKAFAKISCPNAGFQLFTYMEAVLFGFGPFLCSILSYIKVIIVILHIKSSDGRRKAFSTCSSHLIVLSMFYGTWMSVYIMPPLKDPRVFELTLSILYSTITPMLNPLIYSVRNKDVKRALLKMVGIKV
ncbi:olfactory receptor 2K2-like [Phyllobates terribilis]|uniref:olfactory receptor 2K2-like n=1 Tax=Phyllobates terribilis TaxID=111132 RepID=UPI003CCB21C7